MPVTKNLNPFCLDRKLADKNQHEMIYMLWKECMPHKFYQHICMKRNFLLQPRVLEIITNFIQETKENYKDLRNNLSSYKNVYISKYIFSSMNTQMSSHRFIAPQNDAPPLLERILITTIKLGTKHPCMSRNLLRLMILMRLKRSRLRSRLKNESKKDERWSKIIKF